MSRSTSRPRAVRLKPDVILGFCDAYAAGYQTGFGNPDDQTLENRESTFDSVPARTAYRRGLGDGRERHRLATHKAEAAHILSEEAVLWRLGASSALDFLRGGLPGATTMERALAARMRYNGFRGTAYCEAFDHVMASSHGLVDVKAVVTPLSPADASLADQLHAWLDQVGLPSVSNGSEVDLIPRLASLLEARS